jgi:hypothetical protein
MLRIRFDNASDRKLVAQLRKKAPQLVQVLTTKLTALMFQLQSYIISNKLSGQVLKRRTGILASSVQVIPVTLRGNTILGGVQAGGGVAFYADIQEYGSKGPYPIIATKARALSFISGGKRIFTKSVEHPGLEPRPFMSTSLAEFAPTIQSELAAALNEAIQKDDA